MNGIEETVKKIVKLLEDADQLDAYEDDCNPDDVKKLQQTKQQLRQMGEKFNEIGGAELMFLVYKAVAELLPESKEEMLPLLSWSWNKVGKWKA